MFFYDAVTKVGNAVQGWINGSYPAKEEVKPRVYHKYLKDSDKALLYPETEEEEGEDESQGGETSSSVAAYPVHPVDEDEDPQAE